MYSCLNTGGCTLDYTDQRLVIGFGVIKDAPPDGDRTLVAHVYRLVERFGSTAWFLSRARTFV